MELRPLDDRVVIKPSEAQDKTAGGIFLPDASREKPMIGKVSRTRLAKVPKTLPRISCAWAPAAVRLPLACLLPIPGMAT
jgi:hypothetical protein